MTEQGDDRPQWFPDVEPYVTRQQLAKTMNVSIGTIDKMVREGMPAETWGKRTRRFRASDALAWAQARGPRTSENSSTPAPATGVERLRRPVPRLALNQGEAAEALGMSVDTFAEHVKPKIRCVFAGSRKLYPVRALEQWLADEAVGPEA